MDKLANKALTVQEKLIDLLGVKEDPSVSVIVNKEEASPRNEKFRILVKNSIKEALHKLTVKRLLLCRWKSPTGWWWMIPLRSGPCCGR